MKEHITCPSIFFSIVVADRITIPYISYGEINDAVVA